MSFKLSWKTHIVSYIIAALMVPITIMHESLHALIDLCFGGKVKIGFKGIYVYFREKPGIKLAKTQFIIVLLTPVIIENVTK